MMGRLHWRCMKYLPVAVLFIAQINALTTQTVYGFLDFTTTVGNTVMVFSPQSAPSLDLKKSDETENIIKVEPLVHEKENISPTKLSSFVDSTTQNPKEKTKLSALSNVTSLHSKVAFPPSSHVVTAVSSITVTESNLNRPEYNLLSRQPAEYAEETYRIINYKSSPGSNGSGRLSEVHQSVSVQPKNRKSSIRPSAPLRVLKTAAPAAPKSSSNHPKTSQRQSAAPSRPRKTQKHKSTDQYASIEPTSETITETITTKKSRSRSKSKRRNKNSSHSNSNSKSSSNTESSNRRSFRSKIQPSAIEAELPSNLSTFKLNRTPGRWQYRTSPKPRIAIRKFSNDSPATNASLYLATNGDISNVNQNTILDPTDLESSGSQNGGVVNNLDQDSKPSVFAETLNVEISTPSDFKSTYYEIATIKTPYIFQAGVVKKTRFITVTSTIEKTLQPEPTAIETRDGEPLIENILTSGTSTDRLSLDSSVHTLHAIHLANENETPSLETITETVDFSTTKLKTQILPVIRDHLNETSFVTLIQTYDVTTFITATKTVLPSDDNEFVATKHFKDFSGLLDEAGSEINLELEFGDMDNAEVPDPKQNEEKGAVSRLPETDLNPQATNSPNYLNDDQIKQLALLNIYKPDAKLSTVITTSQPYVVAETVWESYVVPIVSGTTTNYRTLSKSIGTVDKVHYNLDTKTVLLPSIPPPQLSVNPYLIPQLQQFQTITSSVVHQTIATQTNSKVLKLTFGAKTAYTTIFSTAVVPTTLTMYLTTSLPVQPTAAFPPYFGPPYNPFPFVG